MSWWGWLILLAVLGALIGLYLSVIAGRLDVLNKRVDAARHSLDVHLLRRASAASELAGTGLLDPASSMLIADAATAARRAVESDPAAHAHAESDLTAVLAAAFAEPDDVAELRATPVGAQIADELDTVTRRVEMSRRFLNDGVRATRDVMDKRLVRWFHLAGYTPRPETFEMLDTPPAGFGVR